MTYASSPFTSLLPLPSPPPHHDSKSSKLVLYYGIAVVGITAILLAVYNITILRWCANHHRDMTPQQATQFLELSSTSQISDNPNLQIARSFKYKKEQGLGGQDQGHDHDCPVCLSPFEDGEEVRQLQRCKHSFHGPCIDMWLHYHLDCPVCRAPVGSPILWCHVTEDHSDNSRGLLLGSRAV